MLYCQHYLEKGLLVSVVDFTLNFTISQWIINNATLVTSTINVVYQ